jgi:hypothetical protein
MLILKFKKLGFAVSFIDWYLSLTSTGTGTYDNQVANPNKKKNSYFCNISHKMLFLTNFYNYQRIRKFAF